MTNPPSLSDSRRDLDRLAEEIAVVEERLRRLVDTDPSARETEELHRQWNRLQAIAADLGDRLRPRQSSPTAVLPAVADSPSLSPAPVRTRVDLVGRVGSITTTIGVLLFLFIVFEFVVSDLSEARSQRALLGEFRSVMSGGAFVAPPPDAIGQEQAEVTAPPRPAAGDPVALLQIPSLGIEKVVVEGSTAQETKQGPGHLMGSPMPGEVGRVVLAGRRTTYGAPFARIDELSGGDDVVLTTPKGRFTYEVDEVRTIDAGSPDVLAPDQSSNSLILTTSNPEYLASERLVVIASLQGDPVSLPERQPMVVGEDMTGASGDTRSLWLILVWTQVLIAALVGTWMLYRRWPARIAYLITTPIALALVFLLFENLDRLLPSTL